MAKKITSYECDFCSREFDNLDKAKLHEANCYSNPKANINEKKYQWLFMVSTSGSGYTYPFNITPPLTEGEFLSKYTPTVSLISYLRLDGTNLNMTSRNTKTFWHKLNKAVEEQIVNPVATGIEKCKVIVDNKEIQISFNHQTGEITLIKGESNG